MKRKAFKKDKRLKVWHKYGEKCAYCGDDIFYNELQIDHIIPILNYSNWINQYKLNGYNKGIPSYLLHLKIDDANSIENLNPSCRKCNKFKSTFSIEGFRNEIRLQVDRLNNYITQYERAKKYGLVEETGNPVVFYFEQFVK